MPKKIKLTSEELNKITSKIQEGVTPVFRISGGGGGASGGGGGSGTVTSVALAFANNGSSPLFTISGSPVTTAGTLTATFVPNTGWTVSNVTPDKVLDPTSTTLNETSMVLATLIQALIQKGILSA